MKLFTKRAKIVEENNLSIKCFSLKVDIRLIGNIAFTVITILDWEVYNQYKHHFICKLYYYHCYHPNDIG